MGQLLIHTVSRLSYILNGGDVLYVDLETHRLQMGDKANMIFLARDSKTGRLNENCWTIAVPRRRQYKTIAETLALSHGWIIASEGGGGKKQHYVLGVDKDCSLKNVPTLLRYERDLHKIFLVYVRGDMTAEGNARIVELPGDLRPYDFDIVDLIASSHGLPCSEYSHRDHAFIWSRKNKR